MLLIEILYQYDPPAPYRRTSIKNAELLLVLSSRRGAFSCFGFDRNTILSVQQLRVSNSVYKSKTNWYSLDEVASTEPTPE